MPDATIDRALTAHRAACDAFVAAAEHVAPAKWSTPRGPGKWTPGQEVAHIVLVYEAFARDLRAGEPVRVVGTRLKRLVWRAIGLTMILRLRKMPRGARAFRESRPPETTGDRASLIATVRGRMHEFDAAFADAWRTNPRKRVTHPYFGTVSLSQAIVLAEVHTLHHAEFLRLSATSAEPLPTKGATLVTS
jgi:hypothetical protein